MGVGLCYAYHTILILWPAIEEGRNGIDSGGGGGSSSGVVVGAVSC